MGSGGIYTLSIKQTDLIKPASPVQNQLLPMSNLHLLIPPLDVGVFFCYKKPIPHEKFIDLIKKSLAVALVPYYSLSGEVVQNNLGELEILCNNHGVEFVHACADLELKDLDLHHPDDSVQGKQVPKTKGVLSVQATEFSCGGLVIGCTFDHRVADAHSMNMFLVSWADITRSEPISRNPSFMRSMLHPRCPPRINPSYDSLYIPFSCLPPPSSLALTNPLISRVYYIKADEIHNLQQSSSLNVNQQSKLMSFISFLWKLIANGDDESKSCRLGVVVDGRERLSEDNMQNYFGNVLSIPSGEANSGHLNEMKLSEVSKMVGKFVKIATTKDHFRGLIDWVEVLRPETAVTKIYTEIGNNDGGAVVVSSGLHFKFETVDFGWWKPHFGSYRFPWGGQNRICYAHA